MKIPVITWAQNSKTIFLNIILEPNENCELSVNENIFKFKQDEYEVELELLNFVKNIKINKNRIIEIDLLKNDFNFWDSLLKDPKLFKNNIGIDWRRWIDEDSDDEILSQDSDDSLKDNLESLDEEYINRKELNNILDENTSDDE